MHLFVSIQPDSRCHVGVPLHEALHSRGNVPAPSGLLPASPQQLLRLLRPVPPSRRLGRAWSQCLLHLLWGLPPDELLPLPCSPQVSRVWTNVLLTLLRHRMSCCVSSVGVILICLDFGIKLSNNLTLSSLNHSRLQVSWLWPESFYPYYCRFFYLWFCGEQNFSWRLASSLYSQLTCFVAGRMVRRGERKEFDQVVLLYAFSLVCSDRWRATCWMDRGRAKSSERSNLSSFNLQWASPLHCLWYHNNPDSFWTGWHTAYLQTWRVRNRVYNSIMCNGCRVCRFLKPLHYYRMCFQPGSGN